MNVLLLRPDPGHEKFGLGPFFRVEPLGLEYIGAAPLAGIPAGRMLDPHISFFARRNPGYHAGDELVCLCELSETNLTPAGRRMTHLPRF